MCVCTSNKWLTINSIVFAYMHLWLVILCAVGNRVQFLGIPMAHDGAKNIDTILRMKIASAPIICSFVYKSRWLNRYKSVKSFES